jgi:hypothetical protein
MKERATLAFTGGGPLRAALDAASITFGLDGYVAERRWNQTWCYLQRVKILVTRPVEVLRDPVAAAWTAAHTSGAVWRRPASNGALAARADQMVKRPVHL